MKVGNINPVLFKAHQANNKKEEKLAQRKEIKELNYVTPDFAVKTPQRYQKLDTIKLSNGLDVHSYKLANGYRVTIVPMEGSPATVKNYVNVGSMNETDDIKGISHFLEHMAFNGTTGDNGYIKLNTGDSFKKIDKLGGWTNASTNYALTDYVNSTPLLDNRDLEEQIKIIAAMTEDLALTQEMIEKEKGPVCSEINMILDNPQTILTDQTVRTLFNIKSSADELVGGSTDHIKNLTREKVKAYYDKYYTPDNMNLVITGDVKPDEVIKIVAKNFHSMKSKKSQPYEEKMVPIKKTVRKDFITDKASSTEIMLGFAGPKSNDRKSKIICHILNKHLNSTDTGISKELKKFNSFGDFGFEKISTNKNNPMMMYYALDCAEENSEKALKVIFDKFSTLKAPNKENLEIIKESLLQTHKNSLEYSSFVNNAVGNSIIDGTLENFANYEKNLKEITVADVQSFIDTYFDLNKAAVTVVHPKTTIEKISANHSEASKLSFKGRKQAINPNKISEETLKNNFKIGYYQTNNDNIYYGINLNYSLPQNISPATVAILYYILEMGTLKDNENEFKNYQEKNNINIASFLSTQEMGISANSSQKNFLKTIEKTKELLYSPRITDQEFEIAKKRIKDAFARTKESANKIYNDYEAKNNPLVLSKEQILKDIEKVTLEDVKKLHKYIIANSTGTIAINTPINNPETKEISKKAFEEFSNVKEYKYKLAEVYRENSKPVILTKEKPVSQADIAEVFKFKFEDTVKERAMMNIMNTILSSSSIGLFNTLREKEHLAYSVHSEISKIGDSAELSCHILTTTDNLETGERSYDNLQKSINGFNRQIGALINSEYTDEDLESAKRIFKARLLNKEGVSSKLAALNNGLDSREGLLFENLLLNEIDNITRDDIDRFSKKVFKKPPVYAIVASKDTLNANEKYLQNLEKRGF